MCNCYMIWRSIVTILFYILDVASDIAASVYFISVKKEIVWGIATLVLVFLPAAFNLILVASAYAQCFRRRQADNYEQMLLYVPWIRRQASWKKRWMHYTLIFFRFEPIYSHIKLIHHGAKRSEERLEFETKTMAEMFLEVCLQSLPQIILQVYILGKDNTASGIQIVCIVLSLAKTWYVVTSINFKKGKEKCNVRWWWWFVKIFWVLFGGMPFLVSSFPAISLFSAVYGPFYLCFHLLAIFLFLIKWWWWRIPVRRKYDDIKTRTIYGFIVTIIKTIFTMLVIMWFIRVKKFENRDDTYQSPLITRAIPPSIWPEPNTCLKSWSTHGLKYTDPPANMTSPPVVITPKWAQCDRSKMFRNGIFVTNITAWCEQGTMGSNVLDFLNLTQQKDLFCVTDLTDILFVILFYCVLISYLWDICYYIIRMFVNPDECNSDNYVITRRSDELHEERIRLKATDGNENHDNHVEVDTMPTSHI